MRQIALQNIPNQTLTIQLDQTFYALTIRACVLRPAQIMAVDVSINDVLIVSGARAVAGFPIIPTLYQQNGNFTIVTTNQELPAWQEFGISQYLIYASQAELEVIDATAP